MTTQELYNFHLKNYIEINKGTISPETNSILYAASMIVSRLDDFVKLLNLMVDPENQLDKETVGSEVLRMAGIESNSETVHRNDQIK